MAEIFFTWWSCAFFKVTYSGQKLNYKDSLPSPWHGSVGYSLCVCQLSCPKPAQLHKIAVPCAKQKQVVDTHPPEHSGPVWSSLPTTLASLTPKLWQTRQHGSIQYPTVGDPSCLACSGGCDMKIPISTSSYCQFFLGFLACIFIPSTGDVIATWAVSPTLPMLVNNKWWSNIVSVLCSWPKEFC